MTSPEAVLAAPSAVGGLAAASWRDYLALLKPRVMSLVIFTAVTGLICAGRPMDPALAFVAILCIAVGAGGSAALNMAFDADIDALMQRTRRRPVPAGRIQAGDAKTLGFLLSVFSVGVVGLAENLLAAGLLAFTIAFYVGVYTLWLKRRTPQNIVIGGLAGALPPAVGWAAASGTTPLNAWLLVAIIFIWTPPHFWALALYTKADYARAGVPMMPVVRGEASTRRQILAYCLLLAPVGAAPAFTGLGGWLYLAVAVLGGAALVGLAARLMALGSGGVGEARAPMAGKQTLYAVRQDAKPARDLFAVSLAYLFALFAALLAEKLIGLPPLVPHP